MGQGRAYSVWGGVQGRGGRLGGRGESRPEHQGDLFKAPPLTSHDCGLIHLF